MVTRIKNDLNTAEKVACIFLVINFLSQLGYSAIIPFCVTTQWEKCLGLVSTLLSCGLTFFPAIFFSEGEKSDEAMWKEDKVFLAMLLGSAIIQLVLAGLQLISTNHPMLTYFNITFSGAFVLVLMAGLISHAKRFTISPPVSNSRPLA